MTSISKCPKCGFDLTGPASVCPMCGSRIVSPPGAKIWILMLVQIVASTAFMVAFRFPKIMIVIFVGLILVGTAASAWAKTRPVPIPVPPKPLSSPILFRIASIGVATSRDGVAADELLDEADAAMYRDKRQQQFDTKAG